MLEVRGLEASYGNIRALKGIDLSVPAGSIVSIVGANGAGKTTLLKTIAGAIRPRAGTVTFLDDDITGSRPDRIVRKGIALVPEGRAILARMTVLENLEMGAYHRKDAGVAADLAGAMERFPILGARRQQQAGLLSGGEQQMLAIARALMARPKLLLLDEPSLGLAPIVVQQLFAVIREIRERGTTILLVEQNAHMALSVADRGYVLETGSLTVEGSASTLLDNEDVRAAYLGGGRGSKADEATR